MTAAQDIFLNPPACECGVCWRLDRENDPKAWPTIAPPRTWSEGTIRVAVPIVVKLPVGLFHDDTEVHSECEFFGHSLNEARTAARLHLRRPGFCHVARFHYTKLVLPDGTVERYR
jgi:hypothetical protein